MYAEYEEVVQIDFSHGEGIGWHDADAYLNLSTEYYQQSPIDEIYYDFTVEEEITYDLIPAYDVIVDFYDDATYESSDVNASDPEWLYSWNEPNYEEVFTYEEVSAYQHHDNFAQSTHAYGSTPSHWDFI